MATYFAIDPGKHKLGWAACVDGKWYAGSIKDWGWEDVSTLVMSVRGLALDGGVRRRDINFVTEGQYYKRNARVFGSLRYICGGLEALAEVFGNTVYEAVQPSVWKPALLTDYYPHGYKNLTTRQRYECSHAASIVRAEEVSGLGVGKCHDTADAINICDWLRLEVEGDQS